jgi:hypothetical protein
VPPEFYTPQDIAKAMKLAYRTVLEHIRRGHLRASGCGLDGGAPYRIHACDYETWRLWLIGHPSIPEPPSGAAPGRT